jgi:hypothetical protein
MTVVPVTDDRRTVVNADLLAAAEGVHRQLRPHFMTVSSLHFDKKISAANTGIKSR